MKVLIQSKTLQITQALRLFIERQAAKIIRQQPRIGVVTVFLESVSKKKNDVQAAIARIKIDLPGRDVIVERRARDMYQAVVAATVRTRQALSHLKERRLHAKRQPRLGLAQIGWA